MRLTDFWERMERRFGRLYAYSFAADMVIAELGSRTVSQALADYIDFLQRFKTLIDDRDVSNSLDFMARANVIRRVLEGIEKR